MGANGLDNGIPKGRGSHLKHGGLILPLDVAVGLVVACTMFGTRKPVPPRQHRRRFHGDCPHGKRINALIRIAGDWS